jgi:hypothetical protein
LLGDRTYVFAIGFVRAGLKSRPPLFFRRHEAEPFFQDLFKGLVAKEAHGIEVMSNGDVRPGSDADKNPPGFLLP